MNARSATSINTVSPEQLSTFKSSKIKQLPIFRRNYTNLLSINSGVTMAPEGVRMNGVGKTTVDGTDAGGNPEGRVQLSFAEPDRHHL